MIAYCSAFAPFTSAQEQHIQMLLAQGEAVTLFFLNETMAAADTAAYFSVICSVLGQELPYVQVGAKDLAAQSSLYLDGLLESQLAQSNVRGTYLPVAETYGYERLPFEQMHIFDDVAQTVADFVIERQLFATTSDMARVYHNMSYGRFQHTMRVRYLITQLARVHGLDEYIAQFAALFHDYAKEESEATLARVMQAHFTEYADAPMPAWHGFGAAQFVFDTYGEQVRESGVYEAIAFHTIGKANYHDLGLALFIADYCDYRRPFTAETSDVWQAAQTSLQTGAYKKIVHIEQYFAESEKELYRTTKDMLVWLETELKIK